MGNAPLTKICSSCGQQKPLSAFLQLSGQQGRSYGRICSSCRKSKRDKPRQAKQKDEISRIRPGLKIDYKTIIKSEIEKKKRYKQAEEEYFKEREEKDEKKEKRHSKLRHKAKEERKHRETKSAQDTKKPDTKKSEPVFGGEDHKAEAGRQDFSVPFRDTYIAGKIKWTQSPIFQQFKAWVGKAAPIVRAAEKSAKQKKEPAAAEKAALNTLNDYVNTNYRPRSRK